MLISCLTIICAIIVHTLLLLNIITTEVSIIILDFLLVINALHQFWCWWQRSPCEWLMEEKGEFVKKIPLYPSTPPLKRNKYIARWKKLNMDCAMLPLNRVAFLKARYQIGPFHEFKYAKEIPISFLKSEVEKSYSMQPLIDESHPKCHLNQFTKSYILYRSLLYVKQGIRNVDEKYQYIFPNLEILDIHSSDHEPSTSTLFSRRFTAVPDTMADDIQSVKQDLKDVMLEHQKWQEFEKEKTKSKKKLKEVVEMFKSLKEQDKSC